MEQLADRLDHAVDTLATVDRRMPALTVTATAFGADDAGVPGRIGHALHDRWAAVLEARGREASALAARLSEAAGAVRATGRGYAATDDSVRRRFEREG